MNAREQEALLTVMLTMELVRVRERRSGANPLRDENPAHVRCDDSGCVFAFARDMAYVVLRREDEHERDAQVIECHLGRDGFEVRVYARHGRLVRDDYWTREHDTGAVPPLLSGLGAVESARPGRP